ncbi:MAG TPA: DUF885 family protein [Hanamia sp.]|nr:DUF885 family protein [Hanamia sp.]
MKKIKTALFLIFTFIITFPASESMASSNLRNPLLSPTPANSIPFLINEYYEDIKDLNLVYIFPNNPEYFSRFSKLHSEWMGKLKMVDFNSLNVSDRVDFILLKRNIQNDEYDLKQDEKDYHQFSYALPFADNVVALQQKRRRGQRPDAMATAKAFNEIQLQIDKAKTIVSKTPLPDKNLLNKTIETVKELRNGLKNVYDFYNGYDPDFTWWMKKTYPDTDSALAAYSKWLSLQPVANADKAMDSSGIIGHPVGLEKIDQLLQSEMIPYSPGELIKIAYKEFAWCDSEMLKASRQMGFGNDWKKALEKVKENYVAPGDQPQLINHLEEHAIAFIDSLGLVTIPPLAREAWRMDMLTTEEQKFASYFLGGPEIWIAYPTDEMNFESKMMSLRSNNLGFANAEVYHELIPGHNLQFFMGRRYKPYRKVFSTPFSVEGWAFYWEMTMWDKGFDNTPEKKIGSLFWRMTRCARIIFSLNYHLGKWTPQQCIDYLVDRVGLERASAESEVRRSFTGGYGPLYQLAYMFGALQMRALHHEMVDSKKMTDREFNDDFLHENTIPIEMFRAIITQQKLSENFTTQWRFYDK